ncbi:class I adenylate-forming enzyme family protein [Bacillus sp. FJAT-29814]|uniref:class I adenylate-forming enzyme family protein n=1 Tax=Bacillus sp. FJAT-29814 TaxID=1729688 RepID=UPI000831FBE7|nr:AMP-binding protein [Bacillus sp. FJAT-29814]
MELIGGLARKTCKTYSSKVAVISGERSLTYQELYERSLKLANALLEKGLVKGDRIAILSTNRIECIEMDLAVALAGLVKVPLNYRLHPKEHKFIIEQSASLLLLGEKELIEPVNSKIDTIYFGDDYENLLFNSSNHEVDSDINENDLFAILYTSGTTGRPKGVMLSHRNYISAVLSLIIFCEITNEDVIGHVAPLTHGSNLLVHCALLLGSKQVVFNKFNPYEFINEIHEHAINVIFLVPTMVNMMIHDQSFDPKLLSSLKSINMAGSPIAEEKLKKALELLGPIFVETYGQTEAPSTVTCMPKHELAKRPLSCGKAGPFVEMKIVDENGNERKQGEVGEVICRGSLVMKGYWNNEKATNDTIKNDWLHTGDLGWIDKQGYLYLVDRKKDVIISGGANIYPREVEEVLNTHPAVKETCVFGIPDDIWGESVFAHVVLQEGKFTMEEDLIELCKNELASYKKPTGMVFVQELPKNSYGKILRKDLREQYLNYENLKKIKGGN